MNVDDVFYECEEKYTLEEYKELKRFLDAFYQESKSNYSNLFHFYGFAEDDYLQHFDYIRYFLTNIKRDDLNLFYDMLKNSKYNMKSEIVFFASLIARSNTELIKFGSINFANSSPILELSKGDKYSITSKYANIDFKSIYSVFDDKNMNDFLYTYELSSNCHNVCYEFMKYFDDANLVTSLINAGFTSHYYHTYIEKNNIIYDLSTGIVGDKDEYYNLFEPKEIVTTNKLDLDSSYDIARTSGIYNNSNIKAKALRIALYNQIKK